jgi:hypothetical protein
MEQLQSTDSPDILSQISPQLIRILYARRVLPDIFGAQEHCLLKIHVLLGLSWEELRAVICPLREILGDDSARLRPLLMFNSDTSLESNSVLLDLTKGGLRVMQGRSSNR